jgi:hypothetical protein
LDCEPNPWLERTGWVGHLQGLDYQKLRSAISLRPGEGWEGPDSRTTLLQEVWDSLDRIIQIAQNTATLKVTGVATLYELHRRDHVRKARVPFSSRMQLQTRAKYSNVWKRIVGYLFRTQTWYEEDCPVYLLTPDQEEAYRDLEEYLEKTLEVYELPLKKDILKTIDQKSLRLFISLLDHELPDSPYESVVLSALSVLGLRTSAEAVSWLRPHEYTSILSAVIKISRLLVLQQSYEECRQILNAGMPGEKEVAPGLFDSVRLKVLRYLTIVSSKTKPSPMDWIFEIRAYGFAISSMTSLVADVQWTGEQVTFGKTSFTMSQLVDLVRSLSLELHRTMRQLLLIGEGEREGEREAGIVRVPIPTPDLSALKDNAGNASINYTFLTDVRNKGILSSQSGWVLNRILGNPALRTEWLNGSDLRPRAVARYGELVEQFRTRLLLLMHLTGGQPGRTTEILSVRHCNTSYGGPRNIFLWKGLVCFATSYHKGYRSQQKLKVIHRYLPDEVGVELVRYLWLVLPFWQNVLALLERDNIKEDEDGSNLERSAYLFSHKIVQRSAEKQQGRLEELWQGDKMRRLLEDATVRLMGTKVNIHNYRHIVIAIGRKYLQGMFKDSYETNNQTGYNGSNDNDDSDEDGFAAVLAHQAAHSIQTNGITYGRTKQQFRLGTALKQEQFWQASVLWHRFLGFKDSRPSNMVPKQPGQRVLPYELDGRNHQQQEPLLITAGPLRVRKRDRRSYAPAADASQRLCQLPRAAGGRARGGRTGANTDPPDRRDRRGQEPLVPTAGLLRVRWRHGRGRAAAGAAG